MADFPLVLRPGLDSDDTRLTAKARYVDGSNVRFWQGQPEVIGGWESLIGTPITGVCRSVYQWTDAGAVPNIGFGTHSNLEVWVGGSLSDITPTLALPSVGFLAGPFTTLIGSPLVTVAQPGHGYIAGETVIISGSTAVGGLAINGTYAITSVLTDSWVFTYGSNAGSNATGGGTAAVVTPHRVYTIGQIDGTGGSGYGTGSWNVGTYGSPSVTDYFPRTWALDAWGVNLVASPRLGTLYQWSNVAATPAAPIRNAPANVRNALVSPTDQLFALGCNEELSGIYNPLCIRHSGVRAITEWNTAVNTTAREYILQGGGEIVAGRAVGPYLLIWTNSALYTGTFVGSLDQPWRFDRVAEHCGLIGPNAVEVVGQSAYWLSPDLEFRTYSLGGAPSIMACPIRKDMVDNITASQADKIVASSTSRFNEVRWDYPDARDGFENSRYVAVSLEDAAWYRGQMARTAMANAGPSPDPVGVDYDGNSYWHERGYNADGASFAWFIETGDMYLSGNSGVMIRRLWPDVSDQRGPWSLSMTSKLRSNDQSPRAFGPYAIAATDDKVDLRASGRLFRFRFSGNASPTSGRLGAPIFDVVSSGNR